MNWSVKIGTVKGIEIRVHFTFLLIIVWAAAEGILRPGGGWSRVIFGVLSTCLLFVCVVLHELGHSLVTVHLGGRVRNITLLPIGGVAQMESLPDSPIAELAIAIAGPAVNFMIAAGLTIIALPMIRAEIPTDLLVATHSTRTWYILSAFVVRLLFRLLDGVDWRALLLYLLGANISLGMFNLLPAFPMDGGRVLRGLLGLGLSHLRATQIAIHIGQALAVALGFLGVLSANWMLVLVAVFIFISAGQEGQAVEARVILENLRVEQVLNRLVPRLSPLHSLAHVLDIASRSRQVNFPVMQGEQLVGVLTQDDVLAALHQYGAEVRVGRVMRRQFPTVRPTDTLLYAQQLIARSGVKALPVVDGGTVLGLVSLQDINAAYFSATPRPAR
ncbi:MAG: site-2 protease family protein [Anaerolineae bacterium]|nr:site-2 protease family protein [Anaerolineae bacterium]MDH7473186.1 site-2 protease family protein [Anaerolineae bacterium]